MYAIRSYYGLDKLVSGGASLNEEICRFLININIPTYQGYGLTESSPVICTNYPGMNKIGSSGKVIPNMEVKIEDEELLAKGVITSYSIHYTKLYEASHLSYTC